ncbi:MAG TPA: glycoside hydrolase family 30 beta sandwich domain-containing protein, partial [Polyangiaceae bacterium]|nr:glycoside hydrolase family 30 beta sandwich domain-containing protein [Polyangiaceae bacterium]
MEPEPTLITSGQGDYWVVGEVTEGSGAANITVNADQTLQDWIGFGGTFNEAGWDALKEVSAEDRDRAIRLLFDKTDGIGFTHGRIPVGSSDYGLDRYSLAETPNDYAMENFSIERDRRDLIPYIQAALAVNPNIKFWASPWSPPPWMKDNNAFDRGSIKSDDQTLDAHALYLARFVEEYATEGIVIEAIHPQNEPGYAQDYPSCLWSGAVMADYIANHIGPLFAERLPDTQVWLGTMSNPNDSSIVSAVMGNATARGFVKGIALQWGMGDGNLPSEYSSQYQIPIMQSEHKCGNYPWEGGNANLAPNDHAYAEESWGFFKNWIGKNVNSYMAWNMVLDTVGRNLDMVRPWAQNALLAVDRNTGELKVTPTYYLFRHLGQYVEPGAVRVATQGGDALAFKNPDGSIVTVMYNQGQQAANTTMSVAGATLQFSIPAR